MSKFSAAVMVHLASLREVRLQDLSLNGLTLLDHGRAYPERGLRLRSEFLNCRLAKTGSRVLADRIIWEYDLSNQQLCEERHVPVSSAVCGYRQRTSHLPIECWILASVCPEPRLNNRCTGGKSLQCVLT